MAGNLQLSFPKFQGKRNFKTVEEAQQVFDVLAKHLDSYGGQIEEMQRQINRNVTNSGTVIVNVGRQGGGSSSGSSSAVDNVKVVSKPITAGVALPEVFIAPSKLLTLPVSYVIVDGMMSTEFPKLESLTVNGFTVTANQTGTLFYCYQLL